MVESSKGQLEEFEDDEEVGTHRGKSREKNRSKHSETEQRRRSKINERFQLLRNIIPQNDQKRDKASFLLEVIEYIQFLQEKLNTYEAPYQGWSSEPRKLVTWKNDLVGTEAFSDADQVYKNGPESQNNATISPSMLHSNNNNPQNSLDPEIMVYKPLDQQTNVFGIPSQTLQESVSNIASADPESWQGGISTTCVLNNNNNNNTPTRPEEKNGPVSISDSYSRGVLDTLTQALQSSGVDMCQASISVQIDVATRTSESGPNSLSTGSKDNANRPINNQLMANSQATDTSDKYEHAHKRLRIDHGGSR